MPGKPTRWTGSGTQANADPGWKHAQTHRSPFSTSNKSRGPGQRIGHASRREAHEKKEEKLHISHDDIALAAGPRHVCGGA
ncbi:hypothetical protein CPLU01_06334 [Colletotrichum plurivorum]|uniref:Uncharacterized protein n=1 Tax=Colletotrichum plurivorum TaxID=2175906 RepID=A0A8H6KJG1_9PEZI|nr:hypothetical protein CPLU01_06334 [Colletotrichum plurivorum]